MSFKFLSVENLSVIREGESVLRGVTVRNIRAGELHLIVGPNGSGKTTFLRFLAGFWHGHAVLNGRIVRTVPSGSGGIVECPIPLPLFNVDVSSALGISYAYQDPVLVSSVSIAENLALQRRHLQRGLKLRRLHRLPEIKKRIAKLAHETGLRIDGLLDLRVGDLDVGDRQRLELARAFLDAKAGEILLLDEPTTHISGEEKASLARYLKALRSAGIGIVLVTHEPVIFLPSADRGTIFHNGVVTFSGAARDEAFRAATLAAGTPTDLPKLARKDQPVVFEFTAERLTKKKGIQKVHVVLRRGEIATLLDPDIAALGDLFNYLVGARSEWRPTKGGRPALKSGAELAFVGGDRIQDNLFPDLSIFENAICRRRCGLMIFGKSNRAVAKGILAEFGKAEALHVFRAKVSTLSGGEKQKLIIARQLFDRPSCVVLREPGQGLDRANLDMVVTRLLAFAGAGGCVLILGGLGGGYEAMGQSLAMSYEVAGAVSEVC